MRRRRTSGVTKTLSELKSVEIEFIENRSDGAEQRTEEVRDLIVDMILLARKRGRPKIFIQEVANEAA